MPEDTVRMSTISYGTDEDGQDVVKSSATPAARAERQSTSSWRAETVIGNWNFTERLKSRQTVQKAASRRDHSVAAVKVIPYAFSNSELQRILF